MCTIVTPLTMPKDNRGYSTFQPIVHKIGRLNTGDSISSMLLCKCARGDVFARKSCNKGIDDTFCYVLKTTSDAINPPSKCLIVLQAPW